VRILVVHSNYYFVPATSSADGPEDSSYAQMLDGALRQRPASSDALAHELRARGHETAFVLWGHDGIQSAWARENGLRLPLSFRKSLGSRRTRIGLRIPTLRDSGRWHALVMRRQVEAFRPDVVFNFSLGAVPPECLRVSGLRPFLAGWIGTEKSPPPEVVREYDLVLSLSRRWVSLLRESGCRAEYLPLAFDARTLLETEVPQDRPEPVTFAGSYGSQWGRGLSDTEYVAGRVPMGCWGSSPDGLAGAEAIRRSYRGPAWGLELVRLLRRTRVAFNRHSDAVLDAEGYWHPAQTRMIFDESCNMRLYEATGCGCLLVTDRMAGLGQLFRDGREVISYGTKEEAVDLIRYYLDHDREREALAAEGQARTLREHTWERRSGEFLELLEKEGAG